MLQLLFCLVSLSPSVNAQTTPLTRDTLDPLIAQSFQYLDNTQVKEDQAPSHYFGEWGSHIQNSINIIFLGKKGKDAEDSNCFTTALIHNLLANLYLNHPEYHSIPPMLDRAIKNVEGYYSDGSFNFWHALPLTEAVRRMTFGDTFKDELHQRPNHYELTTKFAAVRANIANDADDTAVSYKALLLNQKVAVASGHAIPGPSLPVQSPATLLNGFRDVEGRKFVHPMNRAHGNGSKHEGGYLTWLTRHEFPFMVSPFLVWKADMRIPDGVNDVDCVANANVLDALASFQDINSPEAQAACSYMNKIIDRGFMDKCGIYYPNPYHVPYAFTAAYANGAECLKPSIAKIKETVLTGQNANGSWNSAFAHDQTQSTLYAVSALLAIAKTDSAKEELATPIQNAIQYLVQTNEKQSDSGTKWEGGVFFSGGVFVRKVLLWSSDAYATALAGSALSKYEDLYLPTSK